MRNIIVTASLSVISFTIGIGFEVSGYENIYLSYGLWAFALALAIATLCLWLIPKFRAKARKGKYGEILEIEVPEDKLDKVMGIDNRSPEERGATLRRKWLEKEIPKPKEKNDEV